MRAAADHVPAARQHEGTVILCADDYAMTEGVSAGIEELAAAERLSATSALVTSRHWPTHARRISRWRPGLAIGLHFNLTLGAPLGPMPHLAPGGTLPPVRDVMRRALLARLDEAEIATELARQLDRFESELGHSPDFIDGHQHVHALPQVRRAVLQVLLGRYPGEKPMLRDPADAPPAIVARGAAVRKALGLSVLSAGFGARARALGFPTNIGFSGVSPFDERIPYAHEFERFLLRPGALHLVMCHPGYPDAELARIDTLVARRRSELDALRTAPDLPARILKPRRAEGKGVSWGKHEA